jgi:hypothetical protein
MDVVFLSGGLNRFANRYIGPYKIAHWVRKHGYQAQVIDFVDIMPENNVRLALQKFITPNTLILAVSTTFLSNRVYIHTNGKRARMPEHIIKLLKEIKQQYPKIKIVIGGYMSDKLSTYDVFDATIMSYTTATEDIFLEYINHLKKGTPAPIGSYILPNWGSGKTRIRMWYNTAREPQYNIETDDFKFTHQDVILPGEPLPLDISRGCIFACRFCQYPHLGKKKLDYIRGMDYIESELRYNYENFGTTGYIMLDDTFNDTEFKMKAFYDMTQRLPFKITFSAYLRADLIDRFPDMVHWLKESGLFGAYHGIESLHPDASKVVGKAWSGTKAREFIPKLYHDLWEKKVPIHTNFIVGLPGESLSSVLSTAEWFKSNKLHSINFNTLGLYGTESTVSRFTIQSEFDKNAEKYGFKFLGKLPNGLQNWSNDHWTLSSAHVHSNKINESIINLNKAHTHDVTILLWYGASRDLILNVPSKKLPWKTTYRNIHNNLMVDYHNKLMSL